MANDNAAQDQDQKRALRLQWALEEMERIHASYLPRYAELSARQNALHKQVLEWIDREQAKKILASIKGGNNEN